MHAHTSKHIAGRHIAGLLLLATLATPTAGAAQASGSGPTDPSNTRGLFLNLRAGGYGIGFDDDRDGTGSGGGARIGYGLSDRVTLFGGFEGATISEGDGFEGLPEGENYGLLHIDLGARVHFRNDARLVPFLEGAVNVVGLWFDDTEDREATYGGASATIGGGVLWYVSPRVALETSGLFNAGALMESEIGNVEQDVDLAMAGVRLQVGVSFYPNR
jgi:hypothetical protein